MRLLLPELVQNSPNTMHFLKVAATPIMGKPSAACTVHTGTALARWTLDAAAGHAERAWNRPLTSLGFKWQTTAEPAVSVPERPRHTLSEKSGSPRATALRLRAVTVPYLRQGPPAPTLDPRTSRGRRASRHTRAPGLQPPPCTADPKSAHKRPTRPAGSESRTATPARQRP